jgi:BirA family biotin operon repressor/biotin-[acetyl-CoA-carboxylase] ligase
VHGDVALVRIKWPNDLVARDGRKVAGVLAEADMVAGPSGTPSPVVVGIGINVNWPATDEELPPPLRGAATSLCQLTGGPVDREALLDAFLVALGPRVDGLDSAGGRSRLADDLRAACSTLGTTVRVELPDGPLTGRATGITDEGHLTVDVDGTIRTVVAGDVVHVRPGA